MEPLLRRTLGDHIQLQITTTDCSADVVGDPTHLEQVILNLAVNARDAMPEGGVLWIATAIDFDDDAPQNDRVVLSVIDTGSGIAPEIRDRMFEPFVTSKEPGKGTGLGLATVRSIVNEHARRDQRAHEGRRRHDVRGLAGAPLRRARGAGRRATDRRRSTARAGRSCSSRTTPRFASRSRTCCGGSTSRSRRATNGSEALQILEQQRFDLVLTDAVMPGLVGPRAHPQPPADPARSCR